MLVFVRYKTSFGININLTFLASFPRSGNTWTRYLLEGATGIFTGHADTDQRLIALSKSI